MLVFENYFHTMRLTSINIRKFRLLRDITMTLPKETSTTVLVGPNNSGKTSVIDALRLFLPRLGEHPPRIAVHDFSVQCRKSFDLAEKELGKAKTDDSRIEALQEYLPTIQIDMTIEYEDTPQDLNLIQPLLMDLSPENNYVTLRIKYAVKDANKLIKAYYGRRHPDKTSLYDVIADNCNNYFSITYWKAGPDEEIRLEDPTVVSRLIQIDMISAQRHVDDTETGQAVKLSKLLYSHYKKYMQQQNPEEFEAIEEAISYSSDDLTKKYEKSFRPLIEHLRKFGYPQGNAKPDLHIKAEMNSETIYRDNTKIYYSTSENGPDEDLLPERYNGLGYKNLIFIVLQLESFRASIGTDSVNRPGIHLIGIEEPEAHLHPQMQEVFINEISHTLSNNNEWTEQVILSTHSSHIISNSTFPPIRYFKKCPAGIEIKDMSQLSKYILQKVKGDHSKKDAILKFLRRYVRLNHCDLFFADKAILVEGRVEKLLLPAMIRKVASKKDFHGFDRQFVTLLEVGGDYAHKIDPLIQFIGLPTLVIADLDSAKQNGEKCCVAEGVKSTNKVISYYLENLPLNELRKANTKKKTKGFLRIAYQTDENNGHCGRSFEEAFIYANLDWIPKNIDVFTTDKKSLQSAVDKDLCSCAYDLGRKIGKVDLALDLLTAENWNTPAYINEGLKWLYKQENRT